MSEVFEVTKVGDSWEWSGGKGTFRSYSLDLTDEGGHAHLGVERSTKPDKPAPQVGEKVAGEIDSSGRGDKLKIDYDATRELRTGGGTGGGSRGGGSQSREWKPESQFDPEKTARIGRAHAQQMAVTVATSAGYFQGEVAPEKLNDDLRPLIDWFEADVDAAAQAARKAGGTDPRETGSGQAPSTQAPGSVHSGKDVAESHERLATLLEGAGQNDAASRAIADYAVNQMSAEEQYAAIDRLQNPDLQAAAVGRLRERTEAHSGLSLPTDSTDLDSIPF